VVGVVEVEDEQLEQHEPIEIEGELGFYFP
jgi:hypothetical protein